MQSEYIVDLWDSHSIIIPQDSQTYQIASNITKDCGNTQYVLKDNAGTVITDVYSVDTSSVVNVAQIVGEPTLLSFVGPKTYYLTCTDGGSFNSIDTVTFVINVKNPCLTTTFILDHNIDLDSQIDTTVKKPDP